MTQQDQDIGNEKPYHEGDDLEIDVSVTEDGSAKDITGAEITWVLAESQGGAAKIEKSTSGGGVTITDAANGKFTITVEGSDTKDLAGHHYHEAEVTDNVGQTSTVLTGTFQIQQDTA
jgi:hypothetical protein